MSASRTLSGMLLVLAALVCFATLDTTTKVIVASVPMMVALWFRYLFHALATSGMMAPQHGWKMFRTRRPIQQCLRGALLFLTSLFTFWSVRYMPIGEFTAIGMIAPLVVTVIAAFFMGDHVSPLRWVFVAGGFLGTLIIVRPGGALFGWYAILPLMQVASNTAFQILTSRLAKTENPMTMQLYTGWTGMLLGAVALPFVWETPDEIHLWALLLLMGFMGTVGHFLLIHAYRRASASTLTPLMYVQIGFAMFGGWLAFDHLPDHTAMLGMGLIAICGAFNGWLAFRESRLQLEPLEI
jgi:drug/metabolite transporter (DMT)-like permease